MKLDHFGVLALNKPQGMSSRQAVTRIQKLLPPKTKLGHAGTLDPLATGVLVVAIGPATKLISYAQESSKKYVGAFRLGCFSASQDTESEIVLLDNPPTPTSKQLRATLGQFVGEIQQTPPQFSAVKVNGQRAYKLARKGKVANIKPRTAHIKSVNLLDFDYPNFTLAVECGKGTYIRTLGRDIAQAMGSDAIMTSLERTAVGPFKLENSFSLDQVTGQPPGTFIRPAIDLVTDLPQFTCDCAMIKKLSFGQKLTIASRPAVEPRIELAAVDSDGKLLAILEHCQGSTYRTKINFAPLLTL